MNTEILIADYLNSQHGNDISFLMNAYALDPMGGGTALPEHVQNNLAAELAKIPYVFSVICYVEGNAAGLINCVEGFSTFKCKPLVNIHDVVVLDEFRGQGLSQLMLEKVEEIAREKGCCKLTLEVLQGNKLAQNAYQKQGFGGYQLDPAMGHAMFWQKSLEN